MIRHDHITLTSPDEPVIFASLLNVSCSVCAPLTMTEAEVVRFANATIRPPGGDWQAFDKSKLGLGSPTPNPCNQESTRQHWFLLGPLMP